MPATRTPSECSLGGEQSRAARPEGGVQEGQVSATQTDAGALPCPLEVVEGRTKSAENVPSETADTGQTGEAISCGLDATDLHASYTTCVGKTPLLSEESEAAVTVASVDPGHAAKAEAGDSHGGSIAAQDEVEVEQEETALDLYDDDEFEASEAAGSAGSKQSDLETAENAMDCHDCPVALTVTGDGPRENALTVDSTTGDFHLETDAVENKVQTDAKGENLMTSENSEDSYIPAVQPRADHPAIYLEQHLALVNEVGSRAANSAAAQGDESLEASIGDQKTCSPDGVALLSSDMLQSKAEVGHTGADDGQPPASEAEARAENSGTAKDSECNDYSHAVEMTMDGGDGAYDDDFEEVYGDVTPVGKDLDLVDVAGMKESGNAISNALSNIENSAVEPSDSTKPVSQASSAASKLADGEAAGSVPVVSGARPSSASSLRPSSGRQGRRRVGTAHGYEADSDENESGNNDRSQPGACPESGVPVVSESNESSAASSHPHHGADAAAAATAFIESDKEALRLIKSLADLAGRGGLQEDTLSTLAAITSGVPGAVDALSATAAALRRLTLTRAVELEAIIYGPQNTSDAENANAAAAAALNELLAAAASEGAALLGQLQDPAAADLFQSWFSAAAVGKSADRGGDVLLAAVLLPSVTALSFSGSTHDVDTVLGQQQSACSSLQQQPEQQTTAVGRDLAPFRRTTPSPMPVIAEDSVVATGNGYHHQECSESVVYSPNLSPSSSVGRSSRPSSLDLSQSIAPCPSWLDAGEEDSFSPGAGEGDWTPAAFKNATHADLVSPPASELIESPLQAWGDVVTDCFQQLPPSPQQHFGSGGIGGEENNDIAAAAAAARDGAELAGLMDTATEEGKMLIGRLPSPTAQDLLEAVRTCSSPAATALALRAGSSLGSPTSH